MSICLLFGQVTDTLIFQSGNWIYDVLYTLAKEQAVTGFYENSMLTAGEVRFYFDELDYDVLSDSGKILYEKVYKTLYPETERESSFQFTPQLRMNPEAYYKTNDAIPHFFTYNYQDNFATMPLIVGFDDIITLECDLFYGKSYYGSSQNDNYFNLPIKSRQPEFMFPRFTYGAAGKVFDDWGINFVIAKEGLAIGKTKLGSVFYNDTFETDQYMQMNLFSRAFKYSLDVVQVDYSKYMTLHQVEARPITNFKIGFMEGTQIVGPFELRFINPFMVQHSLSAWNDYSDSNSPYGEERICAYFGFNFDWVPCKNVRIYGIYAQNEIQAPNEKDFWGLLYPNSLGLQLGTDISIPFRADGYWNITLEGVYASPYLYFKHTPEASLYRNRTDNMLPSSISDVKTWIGTPFGPDSMAFELETEYESLSKWKVNLSYMLAMQGENGFNRFTETRQRALDSAGNSEAKGDLTGSDGNAETRPYYYSYYPVVAYRLDPSRYDEVKNDARNMWLHGTVQYTHQLALTGEYAVNDKLSLSGKCVYSYIMNNLHEQNRTDHGVEFAFSVKYNVF